MTIDKNEKSISILFPLRSGSINAPTANAKTRFSSNDSSDDLVIQGLNLVGTGLKPRSQTLRYMKSHNFSTPNVDSTRHVSKTDKMCLADPQLPSEEEIDAKFEELLNGHAFLGTAKQNLKSLSYTRKWELIQKEKKLHGDSAVQDNSKLNTLHMILSNLNKRFSVTQTLYQLERLLRHSDFISLFVNANGVSILNGFIDLLDKKSQYVYLCCYKALLNDTLARSVIFQNNDWITYVFCLLGTLTTDLRVRLLSTQIVILLTYSTEWSDSLLESLDLYYDSWIQAVEMTLRNPEDYAFNNSLILPKPKELLIDYSISTLLLVQSIQQLLPSNDLKLACFKRWKRAGIHRIFRLMKDLDSSALNQDIDLYIELELKVQDKQFKNEFLSEISYGPQIKSLIEYTKDTPLETPVCNIIETILDLVNERTTEGSIKLFYVFNSILTYLCEHTLDGSFDENNTEQVFMTSLDHIMDNLQSHQIAKRAMMELDEKKKEFDGIQLQLDTLLQDKQVSKGDLLKELGNREELLKSRETRIEELQNRLEVVENQLKKEKKQLDLTIAHRDVAEYTPKRSVSLFETLKEHKPFIGAQRSTSLSKSKRIASLSAVANEKPHSKYPHSTPYNILNNNSDDDLSVTPIYPFKKNIFHQVSALPKLSSSKDVVSATTTEVPSAQTAYVIPSSIESPAAPPPPPPLPPQLKDIEAITSPTSNGPALVTSPAFASSNVAPPPPPPPLPPPLPSTLSSLNKESTVEDTSLSVASPNKTLPGKPTDSIPPPPPLPLANNVIFASKPKPEVKPLKQIHWDKIEDISDTLWNEPTTRSDLKEDLNEKGVFKEIVNLFEQKAVQMKKKSNVTARKKNEKVSLLSRDLAQQFGINLHMFSSYSVEELLIKVLRCDDDIIKNHSVLEFFNKDDFETIPQSIIRSFEPYASDWKTGKAPNEDVSKLERADRIYLEMFYNMRYYWKIRSSSLLIALTYEKDYYDILYQLQKIDDGTSMIKNSNRLKQFFYIVVEIGNFMNNKKTQGIKLSSLNKLSMVKTNSDKNLSFLHVIERIIREKYPDVYDFTRDLNRLSDLGKINIESIESEIHEYFEKIMRIKESFERGKLSHTEKHHPDDKFRNKISAKLPSAVRKAELLHNQCKLTMNDFNSTMKYCGEDPTNSEAKNTFFRNFSEFLILFNKVSQENKEREAMNRVHEQRQLLLQKASTETQVEKSADDEAADTIDILIKKLRSVDSQQTIPGSSVPGTSSQAEKRSTPRTNRDQNLLTRAMTLKSGIQNL
ncbi:Bnr1 [Kluyveromyces lactis]|nr:Bnr1 [Kluyveromyces lactis]